MRTKEFAMYRGDNFIDIGTLRELSAKHNIKYSYLRWATSLVCRKRNLIPPKQKHPKNGGKLILVDVTGACNE